MILILKTVPSPQRNDVGSIKNESWTTASTLMLIMIRLIKSHLYEIAHLVKKTFFINIDIDQHDVICKLYFNSFIYL
jgi:hypothetical protein